MTIHAHIDGDSHGIPKESGKITILCNVSWKNIIAKQISYVYLLLLYCDHP